METGTRPTTDPLPRCRHNNCLQEGAGERLEPPCGCRLTAPQETPAQQGLWRTQPTKVYSGDVPTMSGGREVGFTMSRTAIFRGDQHVATLEDAEIAEQMVRALNRDPAFQKLELVAQLITLAPLQHGIAIPDELMNLATEALRLAREGEE